MHFFAKYLMPLSVVAALIGAPHVTYADDSRANCRLHVMIRKPTKTSGHVQQSYFAFLDRLVAKGYQPVEYSDDRAAMGAAGELRLKVEEKLGRGLSCTARVVIEERLEAGAMYVADSDVFRDLASQTAKKKSLWKVYCSDATQKAVDLLPSCADLRP